MFLNIPEICEPYQRDRRRSGLLYAGQICGVEGYVESINSGLISALALFADMTDRELPPFPEETMTESLMRYVHTPSKHFQPMNANMGLIPSKGARKGGRRERYLRVAERAIAAMKAYREANGWLFPPRTAGS
jgi:methylenetetrahydrofolate--tRNA-(uracil-5-)-methyltransferase